MDTEVFLLPFRIEDFTGLSILMYLFFRTQVSLVREILEIRPKNLSGELLVLRDIENNPEKACFVGWIGESVFHPLALIRGPSGTFAVSKKVVIIGGDSANSITDLVVQESNYISRCHVILYHTGQQNRWNIKVNGKNGVLINGIMYGQSEQARSIPFSLTQLCTGYGHMSLSDRAFDQQVFDQ
ncbi:unnamed protein product [Wuchereria bancrofti]|uniref:FHA domain-containing protein n=1 Tax=Wuchereria bancrofti TaxID=6293 RepID=A0A3P7EUY8_WUCBA|nr:unnamed protein product [Wuchereria bancrofti]